MREIIARPFLLIAVLALIVGSIVVLELRLGAATPDEARSTGEGAQEVVDDGPAPESTGEQATETTQQETTQEATQETTAEATQEATAEASGDGADESAAGATRDEEPQYPRAKEIVGPTGFVNAGSVSIEELVREDKVVLLEFWTYSCYNCQNVQPYINAWHDEYSDDGLQVVGVHKPEFEYEKDPAGVEAAVRAAGIQYPVVLDNNDATWDAYDQSYWPTVYLIDADGFVRYKHIGEGAYAETEQKIQELLAERDQG